MTPRVIDPDPNEDVPGKIKPYAPFAGKTKALALPERIRWCEQCEEKMTISACSGVHVEPSYWCVNTHCPLQQVCTTCRMLVAWFKAKDADMDPGINQEGWGMKFG